MEHFFSQLGSLTPPPDAVFIVGDVIDNAVERNGRVTAGDLAHFQAEAKLYAQLKQRHPGITVMQTLGPGHDFGGAISLADAEAALGPARGVWQWHRISFIWLTVPRAAFGVAGDYEDMLPAEEYRWLEDRLREAERAVLLFHVPLRTDDTFERGRWPGGLNLTIDPRDRIYQSLKAHRQKIAAIFNGHIHSQIVSSYEGIPLYIAPFMAGGCAIITTGGAEEPITVTMEQIGSLARPSANEAGRRAP